MTVPFELDRRAAVAALLKNRKDTLVVSGLGSPTYDLHSVGDHDGTGVEAALDHRLVTDDPGEAARARALSVVADVGGLSTPTFLVGRLM